MLPVTTQVAQMHIKRLFSIALRMSTYTIKVFRRTIKQPKELLTSMEELKEAINNLTSISFNPDKISHEFYLSSGLSDPEDQTLSQETNKPSVGIPQSCTQPKEVQDGVQAYTAASESNQLIAATAFIAGLAVGSSVSMQSRRHAPPSNHDDWERISIRSID